MTNIELKPGQRITIMKFSDFGFPVAIKLTFTESFVRDYAQYSDCLNIIGKPMRKRSNYRYILKPTDAFTIFDGWVDPNATEKVETGYGYKIADMGTCFDKSTLANAMNVAAPILLQQKGI